MNSDTEKVVIEEATKNINGCLTFIVGCAISFGLGLYVGITYKSGKNTTPVERTEVIDSLTKVNDSIKIKVEKLDSIKDAKIIEVSTLDNDSTLKLFYELVSE